MADCVPTVMVASSHPSLLSKDFGPSIQYSESTGGFFFFSFFLSLLKITENYSLTVLEAKSSEIKVSEGPCSEVLRGRVVPYLSPSSGGAMILGAPRSTAASLQFLPLLSLSLLSCAFSSRLPLLIWTPVISDSGPTLVTLF